MEPLAIIVVDLVLIGAFHWTGWQMTVGDDRRFGPYANTVEGQWNKSFRNVVPRACTFMQMTLGIHALITFAHLLDTIL